MSCDILHRGDPDEDRWPVGDWLDTPGDAVISVMRGETVEVSAEMQEYIDYLRGRTAPFVEC